MRERAGGGEGVPKNESTTREYVGILEGMLLQGEIVFAEDIVTISAKFIDGTIQDQIDRLHSQLGSLRLEPIRKLNDYAEQKYKYTAKTGASSDDLLVALMMCLYWKTVFWSSSNWLYKQFIATYIADY